MREPREKASRAERRRCAPVLVAPVRFAIVE
jgi:hypothetical protein